MATSKKESNASSSSLNNLSSAADHNNEKFSSSAGDGPPEPPQLPSLHKSSSVLADSIVSLGPPPLRTSTSYTLGYSSSANSRPLLQRQSTSDWRSSLTPSEREEVRRNIKEAYQKTVANLDEALDLVMAIQEESIYMLAPSRLDYIKTAVQFEQKVHVAAASKKRHLQVEVEEEGASQKGVKKVKPSSERKKEEQEEEPTKEKLKEEEKEEPSPSSSSKRVRSSRSRRGGGAT